MEEVSTGEGRTVLFVSHNMVAIESLCTKTLVLTDGLISFMGDTIEAINKYTSIRKNISQKSILHRIDREGTGKAILLDCKINGITINQKPCIKTGSEVFIEILYETDKELTYPNFWISFYNIFDQPIFKCNSETVPFERNILPKKGEVICCIPKLQLLPGEYYLNIALQEKNMILDRVENIGSVFVETGPYYETGRVSTYNGIFIADYYWEVRDF
jgi:lipopolysaccharide transport system ATP-binding protein